jgi:hypothetical protein
VRIISHSVDQRRVAIWATINVHRYTVTGDFFPQVLDPQGRRIMFPSYTFTEDGCIEGEEADGPTTIEAMLDKIVRAHAERGENVTDAMIIHWGDYRFSLGVVWPDFDLATAYVEPEPMPEEVQGSAILGERCTLTGSRTLVVGEGLTVSDHDSVIVRMRVETLYYGDGWSARCLPTLPGLGSGYGTTAEGARKDAWIQLFKYLARTLEHGEQTVSRASLIMEP